MPLIFSKVPKEKAGKSSDSNRKRWMRRACRRAEIASCNSDQEWGCIFDGTKMRIEKCKKVKSSRISIQRLNTTSVACRCKSTNDSSKTDEDDSISSEIKRQYRSHHARLRRNLHNFDIDKVYDLSRVLDVVTLGHKNIQAENSMRFHELSGCLVMSNMSMLCPNEDADRSPLRPDNRGSSRRTTLQQVHESSLRQAQLDECSCNSHELSKIWRRRLREIRRHQLKKRLKKMRRKMKFEKTTCNFEKMTCFTHDDSHWKTPPLWKSKLKNNLLNSINISLLDEPFCFCQNAQNNTFWCLRTIDDTHNYLYCEFITGFITFYDFLQDPHQVN